MMKRAIVVTSFGVGDIRVKERCIDTLLEDVRRRAESGRAHIIITPGREDISPAQVRALSNYTGAKVLVVSAEEVTAP